jgi:hypothetical protein
MVSNILQAEAEITLQQKDLELQVAHQVLLKTV